MENSIWHNPNLTKDQLGNVFDKNMLKALDITCTRLAENFIELSMPVSEKHSQPYNLLHGGASCVLAESAGSIASNLVIDHEKFTTLGLDISATHIRSAKMGDTVFAICKPVKIGSTIHVWDIEIFRNSDKKQICKSRLTTMIRKI